jgi:hypothetical protein
MVLGLAEFNARVLNLIRALPDEIENALRSDAEVTLEIAKQRTPVDTGALVDSGMLGEPEKSGFQYSQPITFGDPEPYYAIFVHENLEARHPNGGQAKFLESAVLERSAGMSSRLGLLINIERLASK